MKLLIDLGNSRLKSALWDGKKLTEDVRLDDGTTNIDSLDAMEYALERYIPEMVERWNQGVGSRQ
ncbi:MAG: type III pantothenate kinase [Rudaea sp.]|nr:type III pantothenate kinase [Rudaea sp.]